MSSVADILKMIEALSLKETVELVDAIKESFKISDSDLAGAPAAVAVASDDDGESDAGLAKTEFILKVLGYEDANKAKVIKVVRDIMRAEGSGDVSLIAVKKKVEEKEFILCDKVNKDKANEYSEMLKAVNVKFAVE